MDWVDVRAAADTVVSVLMALLLGFAAIVAVLFVVGAWRDSRRPRVVVDEIANSTGSQQLDPAAVLSGHQFRADLAIQIPLVGRRAADSGEAQEATRELFESAGSQWQSAAAGLAGRLSEPSDLVRDDLALVQALAPEQARAALALLGARLLRPRGIAVSAVLVTDGERTGLAFAVRDLRGDRARRRFVIWPDRPREEDGPSLDSQLALVAARRVAIECLRAGLLSGHRPDRRYEALVFGLCGRQHARSARTFDGYTVGLYRAAVADYRAALDLAPSDAAPPLQVWAALAEGELARRVPEAEAAELFDTAIGKVQAVVDGGRRRVRELDAQRWRLSLGTMCLVRAALPHAPDRSTATARRILDSARDTQAFASALADPDRAYEAACLFARAADSPLSAPGDLERSAIALAACALQRRATPSSAAHDLDLAALVSNGWARYVSSELVPRLALREGETITPDLIDQVRQSWRTYVEARQDADPAI